LYAALTTQCIKMGIPLLDNTLPAAAELSHRFDIVVDALFGFSFRGPPRPEFASIIKTIIDSQLPVVSVDVPSGIEYWCLLRVISVTSEFRCRNDSWAICLLVY
jgi:NAD(P)H-hydrate epimerase